MKTILAEKPSVAREIAFLLGPSEKKDGYLLTKDYYITWALGHLTSLALPAEYRHTQFDKTILPIIPQPFLLSIRKIKTKNGYIDAPKAQKQLDIIEELFNKSQSIVVATDAGREGELIFRNIYSYLKSNKPFQRLWFNSLTEKAIKSAFQNLKEGQDFDSLFYSAQARSRADWLIGINASQALTIKANNDHYSLGRVQTPTLAIIAKRFLENQNFVPQKYWQLQLNHSHDFISFQSLSVSKWQNKSEAQSILQSILITKRAVIKSVESKIIHDSSPLLFDLTGLQKEANRKLNLSAEEIQNIAQYLYENKFITYPRTASKYVPQDVWPEIAHLIRALESRQACKLAVKEIKWDRLNKHIVNDLRVIDHHGILTTERVPSALTPKQNAVYDMIAIRLLQAVSLSCIKENRELTIHISGEEFKAQSTKILDLGWRAVTGILSENSSPTDNFPQLKKGQELLISETVLKEKYTKAPELYSEADVLTAMENAGKHIDNNEERFNVGLGTSATRAGIIETLFARNYIKRIQKALVPTEKGLVIYHLVKNKRIANVNLTVQWEMELQKIENNEVSSDSFENSVVEYTRSLTQELLDTDFNTITTPQLECPKCRNEYLTIRDKLVKCPDLSCNWVQFRNICGVQLGLDEIEKLIKEGKTSLISGMKSKSGKKFNAYIALDKNLNSVFEFK